MPSRSELPGSIRRAKFAKALLRLGFHLNKSGGDGSHFKIECPNNHKIITIPQDLRRDVLYYLLKEIETHCEINWDEIKKEL